MIELASERDAALDRYARSWESRGYQLIKNPRRGDLPDFLNSYRPDAILLSPDSANGENIAVEVLFKGDAEAQAKIESLRPILAHHAGWRLEVLYAGKQPQNLEPLSADRLRETLERLEETDETDPGAFLMLWPVLEATARILSPSDTRRPQSPGRVVELLASEGYVVPEDADILRHSATLRNRLIHGDLDLDVPVELRRQTERIARELVLSLQRPFAMR